MTAGDTRNVYTIKVTRGPPAADATLGVLTLGGGGLVFDFSKHTYSYSLTVPAAIQTAMITATPSQVDGRRNRKCGD